MEVSALQSSNEIKKYSAAVCEQIRWKKAHAGIAKEIEDHLYDQRDYYLTEGEEEEAATQKAILQMGDPIHVGIELDKTHKPKPQWLLILLTIILILVGTGVSYVLDGSEASVKNFSVFPCIIAMVIFFAAYFLDFTALAKYPKAFYFSILFLSVAALPVSSNINGRSFFFFAGFSFSLSYFALLFPLAYAMFLYAMRNKGPRGILLCGIGSVPYGIILLLIPSITGFVLYALTALTLLFTAIRKGWFGGSKRQGYLMFLVPVALFVIITMTIFAFQPYRILRLKVLFNPSSDPRGYQIAMIRDLMSGAVLIGKGTVPNQYGGSLPGIFHTDYVLTILTHNYGWIVFIGIALLFAAFSVFGFYHVCRQRSVLGLMVSLPILMIFVMQSVLYIASNLGYGLLSTLSLPLVSYGKTALFLNAGLIGIMLSVFRTGDIIQDGFQPYTKRGSFFSYADGKLIINLKG
ncbi:MAG: FtsW/RodA/SpoVE family cell cycle protein [Lachnospiraceae bacterium]|nr:FtsW/RodA/SpoVE family cell cycle protein [Lachnospiraceae bacterium]